MGYEDGMFPEDPTPGETYFSPADDLVLVERVQVRPGYGIALEGDEATAGLFVTLNGRINGSTETRELNVFLGGRDGFDLAGLLMNNIEALLKHGRSS